MNKEETQKEIDWRKEITESQDTLKIAPDTAEVFIFQDEGKINHHEDFGTSIVFSVKREADENNRSWFVKNNNFSLLGQIKALGKLIGLKVKVVRKGSKRSDTRYSIAKI